MSSNHDDTLRPFADNYIPVIPVDAILHSDAKPFCYNSTCLCHEDSETIAQVNQYVQDGLITPRDATNIVNGKTI